MQREQIVFVGTSDFSGHFRGKSFPAADLQARLQRGVGLAPTNMFISAFGPIQMTPFGTVGEVFLIPDPATRVCVPFDGRAVPFNQLHPTAKSVAHGADTVTSAGADMTSTAAHMTSAGAKLVTPAGAGMTSAGAKLVTPAGGDVTSAGVTEYFFLGDIQTLEGAPWSYCPRHILRRSLERLRAETGLRVLATFEQEFVYSGVPAHPAQPYALDAYRRQGMFGEALLAALRQAGVVPDSFLAEFGARQFEVTVAPAVGLRAADEAVITRELTQAVASRLGHRVSFAPLPEPDASSNGTHIHWSFLDENDQPVLYDEKLPLNLSAAGSYFVAGVLHHLPALCAVTAPSVASYYRLRPNRWAPVHADLGALDRGAALRICPAAGNDLPQRSRQFNVEFRVADATASPYLALAALIQAGLDGVRQRRTIDSGQAQTLPSSLEEALALLEASDWAAEWLGAEVLAAYVGFKRAEIKSLEHLDETEICRRYADVY